MARPSTTLQLPCPIPDAHAPFAYSPTEGSLSTSLVSPIEISQQLQRVDALHQQLKAETVRAQEFLQKLRRGETEAQTQSQAQAQAVHLEQQQQQQHQRQQQHHHHHHPHHHQHQHQEHDRQPRKTAASVASRNGDHTHHGVGDSPASHESVCKCSCPHHPPLSPTSEPKIRKAAGSHDMPVSLHTHVDEREVRDLEKRVRGLEGRVRGFEGLPPDRELALLEVERLRKELEGLARRREGLFEVVEKEMAETGPRKETKVGAVNGKPAGSSKPMSNGKITGQIKR